MSRSSAEGSEFSCIPDLSVVEAEGVVSDDFGDGLGSGVWGLSFRHVRQLAQHSISDLVEGFLHVVGCLCPLFQVRSWLEGPSHWWFHVRLFIPPNFVAQERGCR